jgi:hexosaminidase
MSNFLEEVSKAFDDEFMHMGGDEVSFNCWQQDSSITTWMKQNNIANYTDLQAYYESKIESNRLI